MKKIIFLFSMIVIVFATSCTDMDDNYKKYLEDIPTYSPTVKNLTAVSPQAGSLTLSWELPQGELAKSIEIICKESATESTKVELGLVDTYTFDKLELQGYSFEVYTIDIYGNHSIPVTKTFTPIPGREE